MAYAFVLCGGIPALAPKYVSPYLPAGGVPPEVAEGVGEPVVDVV